MSEQSASATTAAPATLLPAFKPARRRAPDPPLPPADNPASLSLELAPPGLNLNSRAGVTVGGRDGDSAAGEARPEPRIPSPATTGGRTGTSATDRPAVDVDPAVTVAAVAAVVAIVFTAAGLVARWRKGFKLRQPTKTEARGMAKPLASILRRHFPAAVITGDVADVAELAAAITAYAEPAPLLVPLYPDAGVPDDIQNPEAS